jgi:hypothetical protein
MTIPADICCKLCQLAKTGTGAAVDYRCVDCCVRLLGRLHSREMVAGMLRSIERVTTDDPEHIKRVRDAWKDFVVQRSSTKEK